MPIVALCFGLAAIAVFAYELYRAKNRIAAGLLLLSVAFVLNYWTSWNIVHWGWT